MRFYCAGSHKVLVCALGPIWAEAGQQRKGTNTLLGGGGGEGTEGGKRGEGSPKLCAGGKLRPVRDESLTLPYGYFCYAGTSPVGLLRHVAYQYVCVELGMPN